MKKLIIVLVLVSMGMSLIITLVLLGVDYHRYYILTQEYKILVQNLENSKTPNEEEKEAGKLFGWINSKMYEESYSISRNILVYDDGKRINWNEIKDIQKCKVILLYKTRYFMRCDTEWKPLSKKSVGIMFLE